mmetsp:Transcript_11512/g.16886  ORF Transcript_11512/g.16886 Transcript_11512/m.16886 type:complete len:86 (+) Transcript_11512:611-868(+)
MHPFELCHEEEKKKNECEVDKSIIEKEIQKERNMKELNKKLLHLKLVRSCIAPMMQEDETAPATTPTWDITLLGRKLFIPAWASL